MLVKILVIVYSLIFILGVCVPVVIGRRAYNKGNYGLKNTCAEIAEVFFKIFFSFSYFWTQNIIIPKIFN